MKRFFLLLMILCVLLSVPALAETVYKQGDKGDEVMALKERMLELGYYNGAISHNVFNDTMTERVKQLQKANGLQQTGVVDEALYELIFSDSVIMKNGQPYKQPVVVAAATEAPQAETAAVTVTASQASKVLYREGDSGNEVLAIKQRLYELGYYNTAINNSAYNASATERVQQFQMSNGLSVTGTVDQATYDKLFSSSAKGPGGAVAGTLKEGSSGAFVGKLRARMAELGYFDSANSSTFDATMTQRVMLLQQMNGFTVNGIVSPALYDYIMSDECTYCGMHVNPEYNAENRFYYVLDGEKEYSVSKSGNVVIFIVDYFANNYMNATVENNIRTLGQFNDFTYYNNCDPRYIGTYPSVTHMLTGYEYDPSLLVGQFFEKAWTSDRANYIFNTIHDKGYEFRYYYYTSISYGAMSWAVVKLDNLLDYKNNPVKVADPIYSYTDFLDQLKARGGLTLDDTDKKYIQMIHLRGAHAPYSSDVNGNYKANASRDENITGYMSMVANYIAAMKKAGVYDDSTIIITADHGDKQANMQVVYWIKQPGEHHSEWAVNSAPISHCDFPGTILSVIGAEYPYGDSIFDWAPGESRTRQCSVVGRDLNIYSLVTCYSDLGLGSHNLWQTYTYTGTGKDLQKEYNRGSYVYEPLAQSFN